MSIKHPLGGPGIGSFARLAPNIFHLSVNFRHSFSPTSYTLHLQVSHSYTFQLCPGRGTSFASLVVSPPWLAKIQKRCNA